MKLLRFITRRPKRATIWRGLISLVLGIVLTVAAAWACTVYSKENARNMPQSAGYFPQPEYLYFEDLRPESWPGLSKMTELDGFGLLERQASGIVYAERDTVRRRRRLYRDGRVIIAKRYSGFPWLSMYSVQCTVHELRLWQNEFGEIDLDWPELRPLEEGVTTPSWIPHSRGRDILPLRPLWPGALYSVLFYSLLVYSMVCLAEYGWRHRHFRVDYRRRHGQCLNCKYPAGAFAVCPECGTAVESSE